MKLFKLFILIFLSIIFSIFIISCGSKEVKKAKDYISAGMYSEAKDLLLMEIQQNPKNAEAQHLIGNINLLTNNEKEAGEYFHRSGLLDKNYIKKRADSFFKAAKILITKNPELATHYFDIAIEKKSGLKENASNLCFETSKDFLQSSEKFRLGLYLIEKSLEYNPNLLAAISSFSLDYAVKEFNNNNLSEALALLEYTKDQSILSDKNLLLIKIGFKLWKLDEFLSSKDCFSKAINSGASLANDDSLYYVYYIDLSKTDINLNKLDKFIALFSESKFIPEILWLKGNILFKNGNLVKSKTIFSELSQKYRDLKYGDLANERLDFWPISKSGVKVVFNENWILPNVGKKIFYYNQKNINLNAFYGDTWANIAIGEGYLLVFSNKDIENFVLEASGDNKIEISVLASKDKEGNLNIRIR